VKITIHYSSRDRKKRCKS